LTLSRRRRLVEPPFLKAQRRWLTQPELEKLQVLMFGGVASSTGRSSPSPGPGRQKRSEHGGCFAPDIEARRGDKLDPVDLNRIGRRTIKCMLLIAALAIVWNVLGGR